MGRVHVDFGSKVEDFGDLHGFCCDSLPLSLAYAESRRTPMRLLPNASGARLRPGLMRQRRRYLDARGIHRRSVSARGLSRADDSDCIGLFATGATAERSR